MEIESPEQKQPRDIPRGRDLRLRRYALRLYSEPNGKGLQPHKKDQPLLKGSIG